jgi:hypothetical protein
VLLAFLALAVIAPGAKPAAEVVGQSRWPAALNLGLAPELQEDPSHAAPENTAASTFLVGQEPKPSMLEPPASNLVGHWKFDEQNGIRAADSSGKGNDGTLRNFPSDISQWGRGRIDGRTMWLSFRIARA